MIEGQLHAREGKSLTNFSQTLPPENSEMAVQVLRDPYNFDFLTLAHPLEERKLERGLLAHMRDLLFELGRGFAFVGSQVPLTVGEETFYLDLLFYHVRLHCYFVIELKTGKPDQQAILWNDGLLESWIRNQPVYARGRLISLLFAAFSVLALILAGVGLYSVVSYSVVQRTNEFGIRMALGAQRHHVLKIVFASAGISVGFGIVAGLGLSFALNRLIAQWVENASTSPLILLAACFLLLAVGAFACLVPATRASAVDPMYALRRE